MNIYINHQNDDGVLKAYVSSVCQFKVWCTDTLRPQEGNKLFVVLPDDEPTDVFITDSVSKIEQFFEFVFAGEKLFIQEFDKDYEDVFGYLQDLFEVAPDPITPHHPSKN